MKSIYLGIVLMGYALIAAPVEAAVEAPKTGEMSVKQATDKCKVEVAKRCQDVSCPSFCRAPENKKIENCVAKCTEAGGFCDLKKLKKTKENDRLFTQLQAQEIRCTAELRSTDKDEFSLKGEKKWQELGQYPGKGK